MSLNFQHACCRHKNLLSNEKLKPRSWHPHFKQNYLLSFVIVRVTTDVRSLTS